MTQIVVDANVAIKWVLPEIHSEQALRLRTGDYEFFVPDFFFPEIGNILWKRVRRGEMTLEQGKSDLEALADFPFQICSSLSVMLYALEIATRVDQAVYDCVYLALAVVHQCQMVTADERFYNAIKRDVLFSHLLWIENIP